MVGLDLEEILVPLDGSESSEIALEVASEVALRFGVSMRLLHVITTGAQAGRERRHRTGQPRARPWAQDERNEDAPAVSEASAYLERVARRLPGSLRVRLTLRWGDPTDEIVRAARGGPRCLVVMAAHAQPAREDGRHHTVVERVTRQMEIPVLVLPATQATTRASSGDARVPPYVAQAGQAGTQGTWGSRRGMPGTRVGAVGTEDKPDKPNKEESRHGAA